jgi:hypothetical protein
MAGAGVPPAPGFELVRPYWWLGKEVIGRQPVGKRPERIPDSRCIVFVGSWETTRFSVFVFS